MEIFNKIISSPYPPTGKNVIWENNGKLYKNIKGKWQLIGDGNENITTVKEVSSQLSAKIDKHIKEYLGSLQQLATGFSFKTTADEVFFNWDDTPEKKRID